MARVLWNKDFQETISNPFFQRNLLKKQLLLIDKRKWKLWNTAVGQSVWMSEPNTAIQCFYINLEKCKAYWYNKRGN